MAFKVHQGQLLNFLRFFFEAIVTVNLTSLLVLTTLFISVSGALPQTAYVKMVGLIYIVIFLFVFSYVIVFLFVFSYVSVFHPQIDIWLIFAQSIPWVEVEKKTI